MKEACELLNPTGAADCLLVCDHASRDFPGQLGTLGVPEPETWEHIAWDIGAGDLTRALSLLLDAPAILCNWSRLVVDCNRRLDDPTAFITQSDGIPIPGNVGLVAVDRDWRIANIFDPYHAAISGWLDRRQAAGVRPAFVSIHSFTPLMGEQARPWHAGVLWDSDGQLAQPVLERLRAIEGLHVGDNEPYSGRHPTDYTVHVHGAQRGLPHLALEVRQDLLATQDGIGYWAGLLADALRPAMAAVAGRLR